jgi:hypothetical protein
MGTVTKSIGSGGGGPSRDYSHLQAWEDALPANLVTDGNSQVGEMYNDSEFNLTTSSSGQFIIAGETTDSTHFITLKCATGHSFYDNANKAVNALRYSTSNGAGVTSTTGFIQFLMDIQANYSVVDGLQLKDDYSSHSATIQATGTNVLFKNLIVWRTVANFNGAPVVSLSGANSFAVNCMSIDDTDVATWPIAFYMGNDASVAAINCGAVLTTGLAGTQSARFAYSNGYTNPLVRNCWAAGYAQFSRDPAVGLAAGSDYNATDNATANSPGTHNVTSMVMANTFVDATPATFDARIKAGSALINAGLRDQTYTADIDIIKQSRSTTTPTIGPWEYIVATTTKVSWWAWNKFGALFNV